MHNWWNLNELCGLYYRGTKLATSKCLFGMQINSSWKQSSPKYSGENFDLPHNCLKNLDRGPVPRIELSPDSCSEYGLDMVGGTVRDQSPLCVPLSLYGPANIYFPNVCFSISISIASLPFEVPNHYPQTSSFVFSWIWYSESFSYFGELLSFPVSLACVHVIKLLFDFLLLICLMWI